ncbi:FecR family protein [Bosea lathyri]|uniref:FecR family protein n=1 Tax=Bosea lathyri TaxID=1036778 RepID=A0A1H5SU99_9HYPH|nr:FecR family protein [Bosea lathyri]SEF53441.1 FecR family protein [Bosea lathyri]
MPGRRATRAQRKRHEDAAGWLLRNREAGQPAAEQAAFRAWLDEAPENRRTYEVAEQLMGEARTAIASDPALADFEVKPSSATKPVLGMLLALAATGTLFIALDGPMRLRADAMSGTGEMPVFMLADGSTVQLNASSAVAYDYTTGRRTVRLLRGQAYFEVARDPTRVFTVEAGTTRVTALGTAFDVRLGDAETDVTVTHNAVQIAFEGAEQAPLRVTRGEQAVYDHSTGTKEIRPSDGVTALAWQRGQLVVDNAPLSHVVEEMNRHFPGRIVIANGELARRRVSGTLMISDTNAVLVYLEYALRVTTNRIGPLIVIR